MFYNSHIIFTLQQGGANSLNSITKRWVRGSLLITILVLLMAQVIFIWSIINNYYSSAQFLLENRAQTVLTQLDLSDTDSDAAKALVLRRLVEQFTDKDKFELMLLNNDGNIVLSSSGYVSSSTDIPPDFINAQQDGGIGDTVYSNDSGERVMAVSVLLDDVLDEFSAVRIVTSLTLIDNTIVVYAWVSLIIGLAILLFSVWSGVFFIRSIVHPISAIEKTAEKIAKGNFDIRIAEDKRQDEIGKLVHTINDMASELEQTEKMKNEFISSVSHELRTPLTSIKGWVETLRDTKDASDDLYRRGFSVLSSETDRLYDMVEELLDFSRMQHGIVPECKYLDLAAEVSDCVLTVEQRAHHAGVIIAFEEPELPVPVYADPARLRQSFINLLDNAVKYSKAHSTIHVEICTDKKTAYVYIKDAGRGISKEDLPLIKTKFYKGKGSLGGNGIGLAIVDEIAIAHGGTLTIESELGKGTTAIFALPLHNK